MKKYFAKYLPVEGEPKKGDWVNSNGYINGEFKTIQLDRDLYPEEIGKFKKVKLFLCSRDVQVGVKAYNIKNVEFGEREVTTFQNSQDKSTVGWSNVGVDINELFKPIGQVSSGAKWVKDGDEFDEDQVGVLYNFVGADSDEELYSLEDFPKEVNKWYRGKVPAWFKWNIVNIKCPCCDTFK